MSKVRIYGDTSGYIDVEAPATADNSTLDLSTVAKTTGDQTFNGDVNVAWSDTNFIGMPFSDGSQFKMGMQPISSQRDLQIVSQSNDGFGVSGVTVHTGSTLAERMRIDSSGRVTMPYQPAFFARGTSVSVSGGGRDYDNPGDWDDVFVNVGSSFNASNGRFTAPVDGVYQLSAEQFCVSSATGTYQGIQIKKNGNNYGHTMYGYVQTSNDETVSTSVIMSMSAGDYAYVRCAIGGSGTQDGNRLHFSGCLIG